MTDNISTQPSTPQPSAAHAGKTYDNAEDGVDPAELAEDDLVRELTHLHETRNTTFLHGSDDALDAHTSRTQVLEAEYLRRHPDRDVDPERTRSGARERDE